MTGDSAGRFEARTPGPLSADRPAEPAFSSTGTADILLTVLWRNRWVLLVCVLASLAIGTVYIQTATPIYTSTARLYLDYAGLRISNPYEPGGKPQTDKYLYTQAELIKSRPTLASALEKLVPQRLRTFSKADAPGAYFKKNMSVGVGKQDETVSITVRSAYPTEAMQIANEVVAAYLASKSEHEQKNATDLLESLQAAVKSAKEDFDKKRSQLLEFQKKNSALLPFGSDQGGRLAQQHLQTFQDAYAEARIKAVKAEELYNGLQVLAGDPIALRQYLRVGQESSGYAAEDPGRTPLETRAADLILQKESLSEEATAEHPRMVGLTAETQRVEARLRELDERFTQGLITAVKQQYVNAQRCEEQYARFYAEQQEQAARLSATLDEGELLRLEVNEAATYWRDRAQDVRKVSELVGDDVSQLRMAILEWAQPAETPAYPQKGRIMALTLALGLLLGGSVVVVRDSLNQTLRSTEEISTLLQLPVLGTVPAMSRRQPIQERGLRVFRQPESQEAEAFRTIRTALLLGARNDHVRTIMITSPTAGDGKSTVVSNLGIVLAQAGQKTIIVDADFRKPTQHLLYGAGPSERCLSSVFAGRLKLAAAIRPTGIKGLHILTCGRAITNPAEVLSSPRFARLLRCLADAYDRILIDTPPVAVVTDAQIIGALCDAGLLVLKAARSTRRTTWHARNALQSVGVRVLGVVVNEVHRTGDQYGYYYGKYHRYYGADTNNGKRHKSKDKAVASTGVSEASR